MREFQTLDAVMHRMKTLGAENIYYKLLAENDNTKQQIYLGSSFEVIKFLRFESVKACPGNFKADISMFWIDAEEQQCLAPEAKLILYPQYPEVRLSGFLARSKLAPSSLLQPVPKELRSAKKGPDGRVLLLGVTDNAVLAYLAPPDSVVSKNIFELKREGTVAKGCPLYALISASQNNTKEILLSRLRAIKEAGWHESRRLNKFGALQAYSAPNGGGYTLEALLGIIPNGNPNPDFMGWEVKAFSQSRITLMTPEPDAGFYGEHGATAFLRKYGYLREDDTIYFTGVHKAYTKSEKTGLTLTIRGFDLYKRKITDPGGGIFLVDAEGNIAVEWTYAHLIEHWGRKHAAAVYVSCVKSDSKPAKYQYGDQVFMGEGTDFSLFLLALATGNVFYDPAPKLENASQEKSKVKARSQFRMSLAHLGKLYDKFGPEQL